jgi:hypothetical protein
MNHPLFVGHFNSMAPGDKLQVREPLSASDLRPILLETCDRRPDGSRWVSADPAADDAAGPTPVGRIGGEDLLLKSGYLICPWLGTGINERSLLLVCRLHAELGCHIYEPGDGRFYSPDELREAGKAFSGKRRGPGSPGNPRGQRQARVGHSRRP